MTNLRDLAAMRVRHQPPPALLADIRRNGRRRIRRLAASGIVASVAVGAVVVVGVAGLGRTTSLDRLQPAVPQPVVTPMPHHSSGGRQPGLTVIAPPNVAAAGSGDSPSSAPSSAAMGPAPADPRSAPSAPPPSTATPAPSSSATAAPAGANPPDQQRTLVHRGFSACDVTKTSTGYCGRVTTAQSTGIVTFVSEVCWSSGNTGAGTLTFSTNEEVDDTVLSGGQQVWDWAQGRTFSADNTSLTMQPGDCWDWTTQWRYGNQTPSGTYQVQARGFASELSGGTNSWTTTFTIS